MNTHEYLSPVLESSVLFFLVMHNVVSIYFEK